MELSSLISAMLTRQTIASSSSVDYRTFGANISEADQGFHITNNGVFGHFSKQALEVKPIQMLILDCDADSNDDQQLYDCTSVADPGFDVEQALAGDSAWKLMEVIVQPDGLITLGFMNTTPSEYALGASGEIAASNWESVTLSNEGERLLIVFETENGQRHFLLSQQYSIRGEYYLTDIIEICNQQKVSRLFTEDETDDCGLSKWQKTIYHTR